MNKSRVSWALEAESYFINLVKEHPCLWKVSDKFYSKFALKRLIFEEIVEKMKLRWTCQFQHLTVDDLITKFNSLKNYYRKQKRIEAKLKNDSATRVFHPKWEHFQRLSFLDQDIKCEDGFTSAESLTFLPLLNVMTDSRNCDKQNSNVSEVPKNGSVLCNPTEASTINIKIKKNFEDDQNSDVSEIPIIASVHGNSIEASTISIKTENKVEQNSEVSEIPENTYVPCKPIETATMNINSGNAILRTTSNSFVVNTPTILSTVLVPTGQIPLQNKEMKTKTLTEKISEKSTVSLSSFNAEKKILKKMRLNNIKNFEDEAFCAYVISLLQSVKDINLKRQIQMQVIHLIQDRLSNMT